MRVSVVLAAMRFLLSLAFACALAGCPEHKAAPRTPEHAPMNLEKPERAHVELDLANARAAITKHQQIEGGNPKSLDQLGVRFFHPNDIVYDAATGSVGSKTYPEL